MDVRLEGILMPQSTTINNNTLKYIYFSAFDIMTNVKIRRYSEGNRENADLVSTTNKNALFWLYLKLNRILLIFYLPSNS